MWKQPDTRLSKDYNFDHYVPKFVFDFMCITYLKSVTPCLQALIHSIPQTRSEPERNDHSMTERQSSSGNLNKSGPALYRNQSPPVRQPIKRCLDQSTSAEESNQSMKARQGSKGTLDQSTSLTESSLDDEPSCEVTAPSKGKHYCEDNTGSVDQAIL